MRHCNSAVILTILIIGYFSSTLHLFTQTYNFIHDEFSGIAGNDSAEEWIRKQVNLERKKAGLPELSYDASLRSAARQHSQEMLTRGYFSHTSPVPEFRDPSDRVYRAGVSDFIVGENIAVHSLDAPPEAIAAQLMEQWMNSPGHRANILRPEFTHMGIGVISSKDSTVKDTLIKGVRGRRVIYTIRHYGTQVFTSRSISFSKLELSRRESEFLVFDLQFEYDRSTLASFNNYTRFFQPEGKRMSMHIEFPAQPAVTVFLAHIQNEYTKEYVAFFQDDLVYENFLRTTDKLGSIPFPIINKSITTEKKQTYFLEGEGSFAEPDSAKQCLLHIDNDRYYELEAMEGKIWFRIPIEEDGKVKKISFAVGNNSEKPVRNHLKIDTSQLRTEGSAKKVFVKN